MALYKPDYEYDQAVVLVNKMKNEGYVPTTRTEADLLLYYFQKTDEFIVQLRQQIHNYSEFFVMLDRFLPNHNPRLG